MKAARKKRKPMAEMNVVPYIDVMLVLLIVFMVTAPLLMQGVQVENLATPPQGIASEECPRYLLTAAQAEEISAAKRSGRGNRDGQDQGTIGH